MRRSNRTVYRTFDRSVLVRVTSSDGAEGWGETYGLVATAATTATVDRWPRRTWQRRRKVAYSVLTPIALGEEWRTAHDTEMKRKATTALAAMGLTPSDAVRLLFHRIAVDQAFPLELKVPNAQTRSAMAEVDEMVKTRKARFASADEMFAELEEASGQ